MSQQQRSNRAIYLNPCEVFLLKMFLTHLEKRSLLNNLSKPELNQLRIKIGDGCGDLAERLNTKSKLLFYMEKQWPNPIVNYINNKIPGFNFNSFYCSLTDNLIQEFAEKKIKNGTELTIENTLKIETWSKQKVENFFTPPLVNTSEVNETTTQFKGFDTIDKGFIEKIKIQKSKPKPEDFYLAKRVENCQWYGIIKNWDWVRRDYQKLEDKVVQSFNSLIAKKLVGIVHGAGGTGKSTLLRRLAINLYNRPFKVIWVNDINEFLANSYDDVIEIFPEGERYLIIIEDYYQLASNENIGNRLLQQLIKLDYLRIVIGDRVITGKKYLQYFYGSPENYFELSQDDNNEILNKIKLILPEWEESISKVMARANYTSLYIILFVLAHTQNSDTKNSFNYNLNDVDADFDTIIQSDIKKINTLNPGIAKALYYWACVYANYKIRISKSSFLEIAKSIHINVPR